MSRIYLIEDETVIRRALRRLLEHDGYEVSEAESVEVAREDPALRTAELVIADLRLPGAPGTDLLGDSLAAPVLIMTSYSSVRSAVDAMKLGAVDYIAKPFDHDELLLTVSKLLAGGKGGATADERPVHGLIGDSPMMKAVYSLINRVASTDATVLITGESGTGKEVVAHALHDRSTRAKGPWVPVNCSAIPGHLIESELFGHERGAFTGAVSRHDGLVASANGGTLFLDEIGDLAREPQARLLRVLEDGEVRRMGSSQATRVDVRLIAATHGDLARLVSERVFRKDFYFRLNVIQIPLPALRDRGDDVMILARAFVERNCWRLGIEPIELSADAIEALRGYHWPGNVRELKHVIERALILCNGSELTADLLALDAPAPPVDTESSPAAAPPRPPAGARVESAPADLSLDAHFRRVVEDLQGRITETELAARLGISRKTLWERRQRIGLPRPGRAARTG